jgi:hypothetical protein
MEELQPHQQIQQQRVQATETVPEPRHHRHIQEKKVWHLKLPLH